MTDREKEVAEWLDYRGLPPTCSLKELIEAERDTAALKGGFDAITEINNLKAEVERLKLLREAGVRSRSVYISIGNSDDKLAQHEWASFYNHVDTIIIQYAETVHGVWASLPNGAFQNACWCIEIDEPWVLELKTRLAVVANTYRQDSIAWAEATTTFLTSEGP